MADRDVGQAASEQAVPALGWVSEESHGLLYGSELVVTLRVGFGLRPGCAPGLASVSLRLVLLEADYSPLLAGSVNQALAGL